MWLEVKILYFHTSPIDQNKANVLQVLHMCQAFADLGHNVCLTIPGGSDSAASEKIAAQRIGRDSIGFSILRISLPVGLKRGGAFVASLLAFRELRKHSCDLLYVRNNWALMTGYIIGHKVVFEIHNNICHNRSNLLHGIFKRLIVKISKGRNTRTIVTISENLWSWWQRHGIPPYKMITAHDAMDKRLFGNMKSVMEARHKLGWPLNGKIVLYTGSLYKDRGIERILFFAQALPSVKFIVVGGPKRQQQHYSMLASDEDISNIRFLGPVPHPQIPDYLAAADVLLMIWSSKVPTIDFCSPMKLFEYMAAGRVIVGDGFPTIREVLQNNIHALLVTPEDTDELLDALKRGLNLKSANSLSTNSRRLAISKYTWQIRAGRVIDFFSNQITG